MNKSINRALKAAEALSHVRTLKINFTRKELQKALQSAKFPYISESVDMLRKNGIIAKDKEGYYFPSKEPIHFSKLREPLDDLCRKHNPKVARPCVPHVKDEVISAYTVTVDSELYVVTSKEALIRLIEEYDEVLISKATLYE
jgi:hypothetical protein